MDQALLQVAKQQDKRQWEETDAHKILPEYEEELFCADDTAWNKLSLSGRGCGVSFTGDIQEYLDTILCHVFQDNPAGAGRLDQMIPSNLTHSVISVISVIFID